MPTLSVKLPEETKQRIQSLAKSQGTTAHAVMVSAIEGALEKEEHRNTLVAAALRARNGVLTSGGVFEGKNLVTISRPKYAGENPSAPPKCRSRILSGVPDGAVVIERSCGARSGRADGLFVARAATRSSANCGHHRGCHGHTGAASPYRAPTDKRLSGAGDFQRSNGLPRCI